VYTVKFDISEHWFTAPQRQYSFEGRFFPPTKIWKQGRKFNGRIDYDGNVLVIHFKEERDYLKFLMTL
jgi:hypothetical protein